MAHAEEWPGAISLGATLDGKKLVIKRPDIVFSVTGGMPEIVELEVERLPGFEHLTRKEWNERLLESLIEAEKAAHAKLREEKRTFLGAKAVLRVNPFSQPSTRAPRNPLRPFIGCLDKMRRRIEIAALMSFREAYETARVAWTEHKLRTLFPFGTYKVVQLGGFAATSPPRMA